MLHKLSKTVTRLVITLLKTHNNPFIWNYLSTEKNIKVSGNVIVVDGAKA